MARAKRSPAGVRHRDLGASPSRPAILRMRACVCAAHKTERCAGTEVLNRPGSTRKTPGSVTDFFHLRRSLDVAKSLSEETYTNHDRNSTYSPTTKHIRRRGSDPSSEPSSRSRDGPHALPAPAPRSTVIDTHNSRLNGRNQPSPRGSPPYPLPLTPGGTACSMRPTAYGTPSPQYALDRARRDD